MLLSDQSFLERQLVLSVKHFALKLHLVTIVPILAHLLLLSLDLVLALVLVRVMLLRQRLEVVFRPVVQDHFLQL